MEEGQPNRKQLFVAQLQLFSFFLERFFKKQVSLKRVIKELDKLNELGQEVKEETKTQGKKA